MDFTVYTLKRICKMKIVATPVLIAAACFLVIAVRILPIVFVFFFFMHGSEFS